MPRTGRHVAEEALALPSAARYELAVLLLDSLAPENPNETTDEEWCEILRQADEDLTSGRDPRFTFEEILGEPL